MNEAFAESALGRVRKSLARAEKTGKMTTADREAAEGRVRAVTDIEELADRDLVVEAVIEDEAEKIAIFLALGKVARPDALLTSNTMIPPPITPTVDTCVVAPTALSVVASAVIDAPFLDAPGDGPILGVPGGSFESARISDSVLPPRRPPRDGE